MPFRANLDSNPVSAWTFDAEGWELLTDVVRKQHGILRVRCCGATAVPCISPRGRYYFRHRSKSHDCNWNPESEEHLELKAAVKQAVEDCGWSAEIERIGPDWKADVLAEKGAAKIAFEIQLSPQGQRETSLREARYFESSVFPWWIVNSRNNSDGFGSNRRSCITGRSEAQRLTSVRHCIHDVLGKVVRQVAIAREVRAALAARRVENRVLGFGRIPAVFELSVSGRVQHIVVGEIGEGAVPNLDQIRASTSTSPWGAVVQFVNLSDQIRGFKASAFFLKGKSLKEEVGHTLDLLIAGQRRWVGRDDTEEMEAAFVWYEDICSMCHERYARVPFVVAGHRKIRTGMPPTLFQFDALKDEIRSKHIKKLEKRIGMPVGALISRPRSHVDSSFIPMHQICFCRKGVFEKSIVNGADALLWPEEAIDFSILVPVRESGWIARRAEDATRSLDRDRWEFRLAKSRTKHLSQRFDAAIERLIHDTRDELRGHAERLSRSTSRFMKSCAVQLEAHERQLRQEFNKITDEHWSNYVLNAQLKGARDKLEAFAAHRWRNSERAKLWMFTYDKQLGGRPADMCLNHFDACIQRLKAL